MQFTVRNSRPLRLKARPSRQTAPAVCKGEEATAPQPAEEARKGVNFKMDILKEKKLGESCEQASPIGADKNTLFARSV